MNDKVSINQVLSFTTPALLVLIACLQLIISHQYNLSQWKGGGFGMFSTVDRPNARIFHAYFITENDTIKFDIPGNEQFDRLHEIAYTFPINSYLDQVLSELDQFDWFCLNQKKVKPDTDNWAYCFTSTEMELYALELGEDSHELSLFHQIDPAFIRIEVWRKRYHSNGSILEKSLINRRDMKSTS